MSNFPHAPERCACFIRDVVEAFFVMAAMTAIVATIAIWVPYLAEKIQ